MKRSVALFVAALFCVLTACTGAADTAELLKAAGAKE